MTDFAMLISKLSDLILVLSVLSVALVSLAIVDCVFIYRRVVDLHKRQQARGNGRSN